MEFLLFPLLCVFIALAACIVLRRALHHRKSYFELIEKVRPLSPQASAVILDSMQHSLPATWLEVSDLIKIRRNSTIFTMLADRFRRMVRSCRDEEIAEEMKLTLRTWLHIHVGLTIALLVTCVNLCFGKIAKGRCCISMASVAYFFGAEYLMIREMTEVMDDSLVEVLEGHLLHGS